MIYVPWHCRHREFRKPCLYIGAIVRIVGQYLLHEKWPSTGPVIHEMTTIHSVAAELTVTVTAGQFIVDPTKKHGSEGPWPGVWLDQKLLPNTKGHRRKNGREVLDAQHVQFLEITGTGMHEPLQHTFRELPSSTFSMRTRIISDFWLTNMSTPITLL